MSNHLGVIIEAKSLSKKFADGDCETTIFHSINLGIKQGEQVAILGASGSGKSTLLHLLAGLDKPKAGEVLLAGQSLFSLPERKKAELRNRFLGFVYQFHHLLPEFNVLENVCMPLLIRGEKPDTAKSAAVELIAQVGLQNRLTAHVGELSGGERQRVALARALVTKPLCVLADEPTGNLDSQTANQVSELLLSLNQSLKISFLIVTHDSHLAKRMDRVFMLKDGELKMI